MRLLSGHLFYLEPRELVFIEKEFYTPTTTWYFFTATWLRKGLYVKQVLGLLKLTPALSVPPSYVAQTPAEVWFALVTNAMQRLIFFCQIRYVALSRQLRKIIKNKYRFAKQVRFLAAAKRLQTTARFIHASANLQGEVQRRAWRLSRALAALALEPEHPFVSARNTQQTQALAALVTRQVRK